MAKQCFCNSPTESTLYVKHEDDVLLIVVLYVDDLLITGPNERHIAEFKADLNATFKMKDLGMLHHYLGIQFKQCDGGIALCQTRYIETLLCKFGLEDCKPIATPIETGSRLSLHDAGDPTHVTLYQTAVGCLIYVCNTRPDIQFAVSQVSRFMHSLGSKHWQAIKRIFCYLSGTLHLGLFYPKGGSLPPDLHAFSNSDMSILSHTKHKEIALTHTKLSYICTLYLLVLFLQNREAALHKLPQICHHSRKH